MPALALTTDAFVLSQQPPADKFQTCALFSAEHGVLTALQRLSAKPSPKNPRLDLFDEAAFDLESSNQGRTWFLREVRLIRRHAGIGGRGYEALRGASLLASLLARNPVTAETRAKAAELFRSALVALEGGADPELVLFKSLYRFSRDEGYPVAQQWLVSLTADARQAAERLLRTPLSELGAPADRAPAPALRRQLEDYLRGHTDIWVQPRA